MVHRAERERWGNMAEVDRGQVRDGPVGLGGFQSTEGDRGQGLRRPLCAGEVTIRLISALLF